MLNEQRTVVWKDHWDWVYLVRCWQPGAGSAGVASVQGEQGAALCQTRAVPAGASWFRNGPSAATAQHVSEAGGPSGKMSSESHRGDRAGLD